LHAELLLQLHEGLHVLVQVCRLLCRHACCFAKKGSEGSQIRLAGKEGEELAGRSSAGEMTK
jgi:hypothetical protein